MGKKSGSVALVGAGCGGLDWLTVRGLHLLRRCDAVVYDDLIGGDILGEAPETAERYYMGKRSGKHSAAQEEITAALIRLAKQGKTVVRLKGGDPFVFGRGGEELLALEKAGIPWEVVPGISSAIAIPGAAGIPVTHRQMSRSVHIVTGHTAADGLPADLEEAARCGGTLVILMGLGNLETITARLMAAGKAPETPAAVVSGGNSRHPATVRGTLADIGERTRTAGVEAPAVIVVGETAALDLSPAPARPLEGIRVGLTGTAAMADKLRIALREQGASVCQVEKSVVEPLDADFDWERLADGRRRWIVLTSGNGVRLLFDHLRDAGVDLRRLYCCRFAVIGTATGAALERCGILPDLCPEEYTSRGLGEALCRSAEPDEEILLFRSDKASPILGELLRERGFLYREIPLYTLRADASAAAQRREPLPELDYLVFSSAGGVELFYDTVGPVPEGPVCVCIGPVTAAALEKRLDRPFLTSPDISAGGIVETILAAERAKTEDR